MAPTYIRKFVIKWLKLNLNNTTTGLQLSYDTEIQGLSRTLKFHFQGPILDGSLQYEQYLMSIYVMMVQ